MNLILLNTEVQAFIKLNLSSNLNKILLAKPLFQGVENSEIVEQIEAKIRCKSKLPNWFETEKILFPNKRNIEQTSSEITAHYKSTLIKGDKLVDLTGGFGVDCYYFSKQFTQVTHCELNEELSKIAKHNFSKFGIKNVQFIESDGLEYLKELNQSFDYVYLDPSRRHDSKGKVYYLKDCEPNIVLNLDLLFSFSKNIVIKASPMLDISMALKELKYVYKIHIVAIKNEVKELLFILKEGSNSEPKIKTVNFGTRNLEKFEFIKSEETKTELNISQIEDYIYEPNAAIMKAGAFNLLTKEFGVNKLHRHSHLYSSKSKIDFPGRIFKVLEVIDYNKKLLKKRFKGGKWNISTRNFPINPESLHKILGTSAGGEQYMFFTKDSDNNKVAVVCERV